MRLNQDRFLAFLDRLANWAEKTALLFLRLQWKLAFLYTVVTVVAVSLLMAAAVYLSTQIGYDQNRLDYDLPLALHNSTAGLALALRQTPPDRQALETWMKQVVKGSALDISADEEDANTTLTFYAVASPDSQVLILDMQGVVQASNHPDLIPPGVSVPVGVISSSGRVLVERARQGETNPLLLAEVEDGRLISAAPIGGSDGAAPAGVVYVRVEPAGQWEVFALSMQAVLGGVLTVTIAAGVIGLVFGLLAARGLARRLKTVADTAASWGQGDFSRRINDRSRDEIGLLAREMNKVAGQLETLLQTRQELAALEERNRLARDLHDSVKQQVFATTMNLGVAQALWERSPQQAYDHLSTAAVLSRQSQQELTALIQTLRPVQLAEKGLDEALRSHLSYWEHSNGIPIQVHLPLRLPDMPLAQQEVLYRVCQEAFANIARHSGASAANLLVELAPAGCISVQISDNGHGFDPQHPGPGLGLRSMQERVQALGGQIQVESANTGTRLRILIPLLPVCKEEGA